jgi:hypothetical protein
MAMNMVGTPGITVGLFLSISFMASSSTKRGMMTISAPLATAKFITAVMAKTWKNGKAASTRSLPGTRFVAHAAPCWQLVLTLACVSMAPLGVPVVPPVYCSTATSFNGSMACFWYLPSFLRTSASAMMLAATGDFVGCARSLPLKSL